MKNIITTMLYPNVITFMGVHQAKQREHVASVILDAMLSSLDPKTAEPCVRIVVVEGSNCMDSFSAPNVVLMDIPLPHVHARRWTINRGKGFNIAVFDTTLDSIPRVAPPSSSIKDTGEDTGEAAFASAMQQAEVDIVVSQKVIPRHLQRRLRACGIVAIERLSLRYIRAVACVSGAQVLGQTALRVMCTTTTTTTAPQTTASASASPSCCGETGMSLNEVLTCVRETIPTTAVVFNNRQWGAEKKNQVLWFGDRYVGVNLENPSFAEVARSMGAEGE